MANPNFSNDGTYASGEIQDNRAAIHATNHESLATIYIHDISLVLDKGDVTEQTLLPALLCQQETLDNHCSYLYHQ